ncbi:hypothetical protein ABWW58_16330 [Sporolactobacillus sp. STCC-11]|uniref:hypothetical protein n=1 Tax=Sporolactobacillus caesalpiniae TaxID=3230362 RepID=UPI003397FFAF
MQLLTHAEHRFLLFVTAHDALPRKITDDSLNRLLEHDPNAHFFYWVNWQAAFDVAKEALATQVLGSGSHFLFEDLRNLLQRKGLTSLQGFHSPAKLTQPEHYFWRDAQ